MKINWPVILGVGAIGATLYSLSKKKEETTQATNGLSGLPQVKKEPEYGMMSRERMAFHKWAAQRLQPDYKEQESDLLYYLKEAKDSLIDRVGWVINGSYGSELYHILLNRYADILAHKKGKQIPKALIALAIEAFYYYCWKEHSDLNAAKVRSIVKKAWSKEEMAAFNKAVAKEALYIYNGYNDVDYSGLDGTRKKKRLGGAPIAKIVKQDKLIEKIALKLSAEGVTYKNFTKEKGIQALKGTTLAKGLTRILLKWPGAIKKELKKYNGLSGKAKITKSEAKQMAIDQGVDFNKDFHAQSVGSIMHDLANKAGYKRSKNASGSLGRYFFYHLQKIS